MKILTWERNTTPAMNKTKRVSMIRSVTTVPNDLEKDVPSWRVNTPQRVISPIRGIIRLDAYDRKMAWMQVLLRGFSPNGSKVCVHRSPLKTWAITPKTKENSIQPQFMPWAKVSEMRLKSNPRYIHHRMANPNRMGNAMFRARLMPLFSVKSVVKIWWC